MTCINCQPIGISSARKKSIGPTEELSTMVDRAGGCARNYGAVRGQTLESVRTSCQLSILEMVGMLVNMGTDCALSYLDKLGDLD